MKTRARVWFYLDGQRVSRIVDSEHWMEPNDAVWHELGKPSTPFIYHYEEVTMQTHKPRSGRMSVKAQFKPEHGITTTLQIRGQ
jgi:hypothetical protein